MKSLDEIPKYNKIVEPERRLSGSQNYRTARRALQGTAGHPRGSAGWIEWFFSHQSFIKSYSVSSSSSSWSLKP